MNRFEHLQALYEEFAEELVAFARRRAGRDDAGDIVHDAYVRMATYTGSATLINPRAYLYRVTGNVAHDYRVRAARQDRWTQVDADARSFEYPRADPERQAELRDTLTRCLAALDELPPIYRHVFLLHRVDGMTQREVATALAIPLRTVERYVAKALAHCLQSVRSDPHR